MWIFICRHTVNIANTAPSLFIAHPPFSSTTMEFFHSRFTELCTMLLTKSITNFLIHAPLCSLFLNQSAHQSIPENLHCATYKKYYLLPHSCTSLFTSSVVETFQITRSAKSWSCAHVRYLRHLRYIYLVVHVLYIATDWSRSQNFGSAVRCFHWIQLLWNKYTKRRPSSCAQESDNWEMFWTAHGQHREGEYYIRCWKCRTK